MFIIKNEEYYAKYIEPNYSIVMWTKDIRQAIKFNLDDAKRVVESNIVYFDVFNYGNYEIYNTLTKTSDSCEYCLQVKNDILNAEVIGKQKVISDGDKSYTVLHDENDLKIMSYYFRDSSFQIYDNLQFPCFAVIVRDGKSYRIITNENSIFAGFDIDSCIEHLQYVLDGLKKIKLEIQ